MRSIPVTSIGQDSHRFDTKKDKKLILGGVIIPYEYGLLANSDGDVLLHSITNAISGLSCVNILGKIADDLCLNKGITDSHVYLKKALSYLKGIELTHLSISIECKEPKISPYIYDIRNSIAVLLSLSIDQIGITATSGEDMTDVGRGMGISVISILTGLKNTK